MHCESICARAVRVWTGRDKGFGASSNVSSLPWLSPSFFPSVFSLCTRPHLSASFPQLLNTPRLGPDWSSQRAPRPFSRCSSALMLYFPPDCVFMAVQRCRLLPVERYWLEWEAAPPYSPSRVKTVFKYLSSHLQVEIAGVLLVVRPQKTLLKKPTSKLFQPVLVPNHLLCFRISDLNESVSCLLSSVGTQSDNPPQRYSSLSPV